MNALPAHVNALLDEAIAALAERGIEPRPLVLIAHLTDRGADDELAAAVAAAFELRQESREDAYG